MSDQDTQPNENAPRKNKRRKGRKALILGFIIVVSAFAGAFASRAVSYHHWKHAMHAPLNAEKVEYRAERMAKRIARKLDATEDQKQKLITIAKDFAKDMLPLREKMRSVRSQSLTILTADTIDRSQIEALRTEQTANIDNMTKRFAKAIGDMSEVLTAEQRKKLANRFLKRHGRH